MTTNAAEVEIHRLPPVVDLITAARLLGIGRTCAYQLVQEGAWPTPVLRLGKSIRIPTAPLLALLGLRPPTPSPDGHVDSPIDVQTYDTSR